MKSMQRKIVALIALSGLIGLQELHAADQFTIKLEGFSMP
ncbi:MAG: hypothetical protein ACI8P9_005409 [Parasphingorhabdus sp.]|jgi:hypothetical protein